MARKRSVSKSKVETPIKDIKTESDHLSADKEVISDLTERERATILNRKTPGSRPSINNRHTVKSPKIDPFSTALVEDLILESVRQPESKLSKSIQADLLPLTLSKQTSRSLIILVISLSVLLGYSIYQGKSLMEYSSISRMESDHISCMKSVEKRFPAQNKIFWRKIESSINMTVEENKPTSYVFLYQKDAEHNVKELLREVSKCVVCKLNNCDSQAINFTREILNSPEFSKNDDFGPIITHLKPKLENNGLMIIENLDELPEKFASVFHNFCDAETPMVKKSAFFFTIKMDVFGESDVQDSQKVEEVLRTQWQNMEEDKLEPLFARIFGMFLRVHPERKV